MLSKKLISILACPDDKSELKYTKRGTKESFKCTKCKRVFEVKDGIPMMLPKNSDL